MPVFAWALGAIRTVVELFRRRDRESNISQLVAPEQPTFDHNLLAHHLQGIAGHRCGVRTGCPIFAAGRTHRRHIWHCVHRPRSQVQNRVSDHIVGLRLLGQRHHHSSGTYNPRLFRRDLSHCVAQKFLMVERDIGDDTESRLHHIGRIQPPAHADLEHRNSHFPARKVLKGDRGQHLEKAGMPRQFAFTHQAIGGAVDQIVHQGKIAVADLFSVDLYTLVDPHQVGRGVEPGAQPRYA